MFARLEHLSGLLVRKTLYECGHAVGLAGVKGEILLTAARLATKLPLQKLQTKRRAPGVTPLESSFFYK